MLPWMIPAGIPGHLARSATNGIINLFKGNTPFFLEFAVFPRVPGKPLHIRIVSTMRAQVKGSWLRFGLVEG